MNEYANLWKDIFNIDKPVNRKTFNIGFWPHILIVLVIFIIGPMLGLPKLGFDYKKPILEMLFDLNWQFYHLLVVGVFLIPVITLMMRRCRDLKAERIHAIIIGFFPIFYSIYFLIFAIMGQGLPADVLWIEIIYYIILVLPLLYLVVMICRFSFKRGRL